MELNEFLPGSLRYQPAELRSIFGYDNLYRPWGQIELAKLKVMHQIGALPSELSQLVPAKAGMILSLTTTESDSVERKITKHDVNAHVRLMKEILPELSDYIHIPLTSYDKISTGYVMQYQAAFQEVISPKTEQVISILADMVEMLADEPQIARTHGQHALPITVGFWLATILQRIVYNYAELKSAAGNLRGKISGATGAYNAIEALGFNRMSGDKTFEERVLAELGLKPALISTQILPPEANAFFFFSALTLSASLAQFGRDCRQLMRTEIGELSEAFEAHQVGSSTMSHKRNPITFENLEGMFWRNKNEFGKVLDSLISEHQRDLVNSSIMRDFPIILVNLTYQLNNLLKLGGNDKTPFLKRINIDNLRLRNNIKSSQHLFMAELLQISLQKAGFQRDAHDFVNHVLVELSAEDKKPLIDHAWELAETDPELKMALGKIPDKILSVIYKPITYNGLAAKKARQVAEWAKSKLS